MKKLLASLLERYPKLKPWVIRAKTFSLPGFDRVPVFEVVRFLLKEIQKNNLANRAKAIAFSFFLAIFPGIIFLFTLIPYIPIPSFQEGLFQVIKDILPADSAYRFLEKTVYDIINRPKGGLLSLGFFSALYFSTNGVIGIINSFDKAYDSLFVQRNAFQKRWVAIKLTLLLLLLFIFSVGLIIAGGALIRYLAIELHIRSGFTILALNFLRYLIIVLLFFYSISLIYYYGPSTEKKWRFITAGGTLATFLSIIASLIFSFVVTNFVEYNSIFGSIGSIIMLLIWMHLNSLALLIGFELNSSIYYHKAVRDEQNPVSAID